MINYEIGQFVVKIKHPDWDITKGTPLAAIGEMGTVEELDAQGMLYNPGTMVTGVAVFFPRLNVKLICQYGTVVPVEEEKGDANTVTTWDKCPWKPNEEIMQHFDLDFTRRKSV